MGRCVLAGLVVMLAGVLPALGDVVVVNGMVREGEVLEVTDEHVKMKIRGMVITFSRDQVESIALDEPEDVASPSEPEEAATPIGIRVYQTPTPQPVTPTPVATPAQAAAAGVADATASGPGDGAEGAGSSQRFGTITAVKGAVQIQREGEDWQEARVGMVVNFGDAIRTADGKVRVVERGQWDVRTLPGTMIRAFRDDSGPAVDLTEGKVWSKVEPAPGGRPASYRVRTPNAIAGVRGTLFAVEQKPKGDSRVAVFEGAVDAVGEGEIRAVEINQAARFSADKRFLGLTPAPPTERDEWDFWDQWQAEVEAIGRQFPIGGEVIAGMGAQIAAEQKLYEQMMRERNQQVMVAQIEQAMQGIRTEILRYERDMGDLPPPNEFWQAMQYPLTENPNWRGPYGPPNTPLPAKDRFGNTIDIAVGQTPGGRLVLQLVSFGPNKRSDGGRGDDIVLMIKALPEVQPAPAPPEGEIEE